MKTEIELKAGNIFIIKQQGITYPTVRKIEILELTNTSVLYKNLDSENKVRIRDEIKSFLRDWSVIEDLGYTETVKDLMTGK